MMSISGVPRSRIAATGVVALIVLAVGLALRLSSNGPTAAESLDPYAVVAVTHLATDGGQNNIPVEPDTGAHWVITGTWYGAFALPPLHTETGSLDVDWSGSSWVISNASTTTNIRGYDSSCGVLACGSPALDHGYGFKLTVNLSSPDGQGRSLVSVDFEASPDDGNELVGSPCTYGNAASPVYPYVFVATDNGPFESVFSCSNAGTSLALPYEP